MPDLAMTASELHKMLPSLAWVDELDIRFITRPFCMITIYLLRKVETEDCSYTIQLPTQEEQFDPSTYSFVNVVLCSFLRKHVGQLKSCTVHDPHQIPGFLPNLLSTVSAKGITRFYQYCFTNEDLMDMEGGRDLRGCFIGLSSNLEEVRLSLHSCLAEKGFVNVANRLGSLQNLRRLTFTNTDRFGQCRLEALENFFGIAKSLPRLDHLEICSMNRLSLEGPNAAYFWAQLLRLSNLSLDVCHIPHSVAPLIQTMLTGSDCQVSSLQLHNWGEQTSGSTAVAEALYSGISVNKSIKSLTTDIKCSPFADRLWEAICELIKANTSLTQMHLLSDCSGGATAKEYNMFFQALSRNETLTDVTVNRACTSAMGITDVTAMQLYLQSSTVLEAFTLTAAIDLKLTAEICKGMGKSKSLRKVKIISHHGYGIPAECLDSFIVGLIHSTVVEAKFGCFKSKEMDFYLAWNRCGRKQLLDPTLPTSKLLPLAFTRQHGKYTADWIYTCLREYPHIVSAIMLHRRQEREEEDQISKDAQSSKQLPAEQGTQRLS